MQLMIRRNDDLLWMLVASIMRTEATESLMLAGSMSKDLALKNKSWVECSLHQPASWKRLAHSF